MGLGKESHMAKLVFGMNQSLDGYVDHERFAPCLLYTSRCV